MIVSNEHSRGDFTIFWGRRTPDDAERSFGGYTRDLNSCEMYTREDLKKYRGNMVNHYPFFDEINPKDFYKHEEVLMTIDEMKAFGFKEMSIMIR